MSREQFREWKPRAELSVKYKDGQGQVQLFQINQSGLLKKILEIIGQYTTALTNRQLYYQLVADTIIPNAQKIYKRICTFITDARYGGEIDWNAIEDRGRTPERHSQWNNIKELVESACHSYRLPRWDSQKYYVELFCEKQAMEGILQPIADKYHIYFGCNKGYSSASMMYELAKRLKKQLSDNKKLVVLYLGDHDPSGLDMIRDIQERITEFIWSYEKEYFMSYSICYGQMEKDEVFQVVPVALTTNQVKQYNPPPNPTKITDPRAKHYLAEFGNKSWELDALKPDVLTNLTEQSILKYLDIDKYNAVIKREKKEIKKLVKIVKNI